MYMIIFTNSYLIISVQFFICFSYTYIFEFKFSYKLKLSKLKVKCTELEYMV